MDVIAQRSQQETEVTTSIDTWINHHCDDRSERLAVLAVELQGVKQLRLLLGSERGEHLLRKMHKWVAESLRLSDRIDVLSDSELLITLLVSKIQGMHYWRYASSGIC